MGLTTLKPLQDRVIIERVEAESKTAGGIIIADTMKKKLPEGIILAIGKDVKDVSVGDKVLLAQWSGAEVKFEDKDLLVIKESDILAIIK